MLVGLLCTGAPAWATKPVFADDTVLYQQALQFMADGQYDQARDRLLRLVEAMPAHAGAWLDLAMLNCSMGRAGEAASLFDAIEQRFSPPPAIVKVIAQQRAQGCLAPHAETDVWLRLGRGYNNNVNQGASNPNFTIGSGADAVSLVLSPEQAPKKDQFTAFSAELTLPLSAAGTRGLAQVQARQYDTLRQFDLASLSLGIEHPWRLGPWRLLGSASVGLTALGSRRYQRLNQVQLQLTPPLTMPKGWEAAMVSSWTGVSYSEHPVFDSQVQELRGQLTYGTGSAFVQASAGLAHDRGADERPGYNRTGRVASVTGRVKLAENVLGELALSQQNWKGQRAYAPGLIDQPEHRQTRSVRVAVIFAVAPGQAVHMELRDVQNRDNISLFEYAGRSVQIGWQWQLGR